MPKKITTDRRKLYEAQIRALREASVISEFLEQDFLRSMTVVVNCWNAIRPGIRPALIPYLGERRSYLTCHAGHRHAFRAILFWDLPAETVEKMGLSKRPSGSYKYTARVCRDCGTHRVAAVNVLNRRVGSFHYFHPAGYMPDITERPSQFEWDSLLAVAEFEELLREYLEELKVPATRANTAVKTRRLTVAR